MMIYVVIVFLWTALGMYVIFGGADFGAGIVELFSSRDFKEKTQRIMYNSIGPIWEANHMWLIIAIVILFVGFPKIYADLSNYLHIPLTLLLIGIIARGTSFTFRNYDVVKDKWHQLYAYIFTFSSCITPMFLGIIAAATVSGSMDNQSTDFLSAYILSWLSWFNVSVGIFTATICGMLASVFSIYSVENEQDTTHLRGLAKKFSISIFVAGGVVFCISFWQGVPLLDWIFSQWYGYAAVTLATISFILLYFAIDKRYDITIRFLASFIVLMILFAVSYSHFPNLVIFKDGSYLSVLELNHSEKTIDVLAKALLLGSLFILPFLFYLIYSFNKKAQVL